ncbi:MAG: hypothetical protein IH958_00075 [Chloroflexi bacterium]|nr:hypothetical protein [Chloroflexota bacterium]
MTVAAAAAPKRVRQELEALSRLVTLGLHRAKPVAQGVNLGFAGGAPGRQFVGGGLDLLLSHCHIKKTTLNSGRSNVRVYHLTLKRT